jgi:hypothetical protein
MSPPSSRLKNKLIKKLESSRKQREKPEGDMSLIRNFMIKLIDKLIPKI